MSDDRADEVAPGEEAAATPAKKVAPEKAPAKKAPAKKVAAKKVAAKKAPAKKVAAKKAPAKKVAAKKVAVEKVAAKKVAAEESPVTKAPATEAAVEAAPVPVPVQLSDEPVPAAAGSRRRRPILVLVLVAVVVLAVALAVRLAGGGESTSDRAGSGSGTSGAAVPTPPASAPGRGTYVESTVAADGTVTVRQWIRSSTQIRTLEVAVADPEQAGAARAVDVVVQGLDGSVLARRATVGADPVRLQLSSGVPNLYLSYRISGAVADASQTVPGRMLVSVLGMDVDYSGSAGGTQRLVVGPGRVTNVACLRVDAEADSPPKACGAPTPEGGWLVDLRGIDRTDRLLAQLETTS